MNEWLAQLNVNSVVLGLAAGLVVGLFVAMIAATIARRKGVESENARLQPLNDTLTAELKEREEELAEARRSLAVVETRLEEQQQHHLAQKASLEGHKDYVFDVAFNKDGTRLLSSSRDQSVILWDVAGGQLLRVLEGHQGWVFAATFSPNGRFVASASSDETIGIWDVATGSRLHTWPMPRPYAGMDITGATGLTQAQRMALVALGAVESGDS